jgi:hypothetical protein
MDANASALDPILDALDEDDTGNYGDLHIKGATLLSDALEMILVVTKPESISRRWSVRCEGVLENRICFGYTDSIALLSDNPLLLLHRGIHAELFFNGVPKQVECLLGDLAATHEAIAKDTFPMSRLIKNGLSSFLAPGRSPSTREMLLWHFGKLAEGPVAFLEPYRAVLERHGVRASLVTHQPRSESTKETRESLSLLVTDSSYVVASKFQFTELK